ncbi:MAG: hypothetical protein Hyperionvirus28_32 [Hyperionvirus sp.]|uniref:Uncharacterized protein n=1 Tax=Hyperionvirus sp. TaxID=2487770 RepID=A0A3G5AD52_9VIRU|nr:MAG: hypothetical protein Hyperionvirus28_32 [Hyperionvirus sp.]
MPNPCKNNNNTSFFELMNKNTFCDSISKDPPPPSEDISVVNLMGSNINVTINGGSNQILPLITNFRFGPAFIEGPNLPLTIDIDGEYIFVFSITQTNVPGPYAAALINNEDFSIYPGTIKHASMAHTRIEFEGRVRLLRGDQPRLALINTTETNNVEYHVSTANLSLALR